MNKIKLSIYDTITMVKRSMKHTTRQVDILIMTAILPLMQLCMLVFVLGGSMKVGNYTYLEYILPGILLLAIANSASMSAVSVKEDMCKGIVDRFRTMDIGKSALLNGHMAATLLRSAMTATIIIVVALIIGFRTSMGVMGYANVFGILFMFTLMYTWASIVWGLICPSLEAVSSFTYIGMLLPYVSSCFVAINTMPSAIQGFAKYQPFTPIAESLRGLLLGLDTGNNIFLAYAWCFALFFIFYIIAISVYHKQIK